jgi:hypothetical protein
LKKLHLLAVFGIFCATQPKIPNEFPYFFPLFLPNPA